MENSHSDHEHSHDHNHDHHDHEQAHAELRATLEKLPNDIPVILFTKPGENDAFNEGARQVMEAVMEMTSKVTLQEYSFDHEAAEKYNIEHFPALLFDPGHYNIKWYGAPMGEEGRTLVEALIILGHSDPKLSKPSLKILDRIDSPRQIKVFVSPSCPYCPQEAVNALKAAAASPEHISLEIIDIQANPELAKQYSAQSVPQAYANEKLIAMGAQPEELFLLSLLKFEQQTVFIPDSDAKMVVTDLLVVGGGPAGLTAGIYGARSGLRTVIIEKNTLGGQVATTPTVENYPGFTQVGGKALVDLMVNQALEYSSIFPEEEVLDIQPGETMEITTSRRKFTARSVLLATGATHRKLGIAGESRLSGHGVSYCSTCDGPIFKNKKVLMVGGGDSALTEALHLRTIGVDVTVIHRSEKFRAQEYLVNNLTFNKIPVMVNTEIKSIHGKERVERVELINNLTNEKSTMEIEGVFIAIGYIPAIDLAEKIGVEITREGYIKHDSKHRTNIHGIYSAGDVEGGFKQIVTAAGHGSAAALAIFEDLVNPYWIKEA